MNGVENVPVALDGRRVNVLYRHSAISPGFRPCSCFEDLEKRTVGATER